MEEAERRRESVASEMTFHWGPAEKYKSIRRISLDIISAQTELIETLQRESMERELKLQCMELERDANAKRIEELENISEPPSAPDAEEESGG